jgi:hypothetical protein
MMRRGKPGLDAVEGLSWPQPLLPFPDEHDVDVKVGEDDDDDTDDDDDEDGEDDDSDGDTKVTKVVKKESTKSVPAEDLVAERKKRRAAEAENRRLKTEGASEAEKTVAEKVAERDTHWQGIVIKSQARAALAAAGVPSTALKRAVRALDADDLEVDEDGEVDGLEEAVEALKADMPALFSESEDTKKKRVGSIDAAGNKTGSTKTKSAAEKLAAALTGS